MKGSQLEMLSTAIFGIALSDNRLYEQLFSYISILTVLRLILGLIGDFLKDRLDLFVEEFSMVSGDEDTVFLKHRSLSVRQSPTGGDLIIQFSDIVFYLGSVVALCRIHYCKWHLT